MANDGAQTGGNEERRDDAPASDKEVMTGVSDGSKQEITPPPPAPAATTPANTDKPKTGEAAAVVPPVVEEETPDPKKAKPVVPPVATTPKAVDSGTAVAEQEAASPSPPPPQTQAQGPKEDEYERDSKPKTAAPAPGEDEEEIRDTKKMRALLNDKWGLQWPDPVLHNIMQKGSVTKGIGGIVFELESGSTIKWHENLLGQGEFVGKTGFFIKISEEEAQATVAIAKNRGWTKLNVYGNREQKEMFWLEAKKQGLEVANFQPMADSEVVQKWAQHQQSLADKTLGGIQNADNTPFDVKGEVKPGADEQPGAARRAAEAEAAAKAAEGGTPAPAAADETPKTIASSNIAGKAVAAAAAATTPEAGTPAAAAVETVAASTGPKTEEIKAFFTAKIDECHHPKLKEGLGRICEKLCADGVDGKVVQAVCEKIGDGKMTVQGHNDVVALVNEKLPSESPLIALGFRQQPRAPGGPKA